MTSKRRWVIAAAVAFALPFLVMFAYAAGTQGRGSERLDHAALIVAVGTGLGGILTAPTSGWIRFWASVVYVPAMTVAAFIVAVGFACARGACF